MNSIIRQYKNRLQYSNKENHLSINNELKNILDKLLNENHLFKTRFDQLDERYQQWINNERIYLLKRIEKLENENCQLYELYQTYQIQNQKSIQSITNLILKILSIQQETRKQSIERHNVNDAVQRRKKQQQDEHVTRRTHSLSYNFDSNQLDDSPYTINDQSIWFHRVKEQDQKTRNYSLELANHSSTLATVKVKSEKPAAALSNKLYYVLNNETIAPSSSSKSTRDNHRSTGINIVPVNNANSISNRKQQATITYNKNQSQTRSTYSNHERLPTQISHRTSPIVKNTTTTTTTPRVPTITIRPSTTRTTNTRPPPLPSPINQKTVTVNNKPLRPRYALPKPSESPPTRSTNGTTTTRSRPGGQITITKLNNSPTKNIKTRIPIVSQQSARVTDLDAVIAEQQKQTTIKLSNRSTIITPLTLIQPSLFSKDTVKLVRPVRSQELKLFSCHLTPEISLPTNESLSTLTPSSHESINDEQTDDFKLSSNNRDFSEDSLNEHYHIQKILQHNSTSIEQTNIKQNDYVSISNANLNPPYTPPSIQSKPISSLVHRLVFPERLGRLIFYRRILSDSDIYQKNCSKDQEILHNVYHLDTIRDYSMEYYMLTTYASDSQLRAWLDDDDNDEIDGPFNENRFLSMDDEIDKNSRKKTSNSSDSLIQDEELDWCSELELLNLTKGNTSSNGHTREFLSAQQTSSDSSDLISTSWAVPIGASNQLHSTPIPSDLTDTSNTFFHEILNHSWIDQLSTSNSIEHETGIEQFETDSTSSMITDEFQHDFYHLCPITTTTSFSKTDSQT